MRLAERWRARKERRRIARAAAQAAIDRPIAEGWAWANQFARNDPDGRLPCLGQVYGIRQLARTGEKAYVQWANGRRTAAWFEGCRPALGSWIVVKGWMRYERPMSHHNEDFFHVPMSGLQCQLPANAPFVSDRYWSWYNETHIEI